MTHRRMRDPEFRESQFDDRYAPHVEPINRMVDRLRGIDGRGWMPYVAPLHGGVEARVLMLLRDPGRGTNNEGDRGGSGCLCVENDDATAERVATLLDEVGLTPTDIMPWNAYPWYINRAPSSAEIAVGVGPLADLLRMLEQLQVVLLLGSEARNCWWRLEKREPALVGPLRVIATRHTSNQAFIGTAEQRTAWKAEQLDDFREAAAVVRGESPPTRVEREADVVVAFTKWLQDQGWDVATGVEHADVVARRGTEALVAEVKGRTSSPGLDVDTMYGQLLRRMTVAGATAGTRYAVVVPRSAAGAALRVPQPIRERLQVAVYAVERDGTVTRLP